MRGDNERRCDARRRYNGPPPHAWGQLRVNAEPRGNTRSTPTCVGTTITTGRSRRNTTVHPHMRGDNSLSTDSAMAMDGPPPHAWGQHAPPVLFVFSERSTPTCV